MRASLGWRSVLVGAVAAALWCGAAGWLGAQPEAAPQPGPDAQVEQRFKQLDKDGDGKLTPQEMPNAEMFTRLDINKDDVVTLEEATALLKGGRGQAGQPQAFEQRFKQFDKDGDGKLTPRELPDTNMFKRLDGNGDGAVTLDEARAVLAPAGGQPNAGNQVEQRFKQLDKDGDGKLTPQELPDAEMFKRLDANGDGIVTLDEAKAALGPRQQPTALRKPDQSFTPLIDLGAKEYQGFAGGLYPDGANTPPPAYLQQGLAAAKQIQPLDRNGQPLADGAVVLLSIGMSNATQEFSTFKALADADPRKHPRLVIVDGAQGGQTASIIRDPAAHFWTGVEQRLTAAGVTAKQVQVMWLKEANAGEHRPFPQDALGLKADLQAVVQVVKTRFPNLRIIYHSSRTYAGYANTALNPEPIAYQGGFAVKWLIEDQITATQQPDVKAPVLPWQAWGPYLWTDGPRGRSDKLTWEAEDVANDGTHPSPAGRRKVADLLLRFFTTEETAKGWFLATP